MTAPEQSKTYSLSEEGVTAALADLDKGGSEDVAQRLTELGIKGERGQECACPIHGYLRRAVPDSEWVNVGGTEVFVSGWVIDDLGDLHINLHVGVPESVSAFIEDFDAGIYPELIEESSHGA